MLGALAVGAMAFAPLLGCGSLPTRTPRLEPAPVGVPLVPPPPAHVVWIRIASARVPAADRNGRAYDEGGLPDPVVVLSAGSQELLRSSVADDTLEPHWAAGRAGNVALEPGTAFHVDVLDSDGVTSEPIQSADLPAPTLDNVEGGFVELALGPATVVRLQLEPAHALYGMGLTYQFHGGRCVVTEVFEHGPAGRAGVRTGDRIVAVDGASVEPMSAAELRSTFGAVPLAGLELQLLHAEGTSETVKVAEGPIYPLLDEYGPID